MPARIWSALWIAWIAIFGAATAHIFRWHLDYFKSPGPQFYRIAAIVIPAIGVMSWLYAAARRKRLWRWEPAVFSVVAVAVCVFYEPKATGITILLFLSSSAAGRYLLDIFGLPLVSPLERITVAFGTGAGSLITVLTLAGLGGLLYRSVFLFLLLLPVLVFPLRVKGIVDDFVALSRNWRASSGPTHPLTGAALAFGFAAAVCALMMVLAPSIAFDAVAFHLPSAQYYALQHTLKAVPNIDYSYYPQGFEMLWTLGYALAGEAGAQLISVLFFVLFALMLIRLARECGLDHGTSIVAVVFAVTMPFLNWSGSAAKNDIAMSFFELLALYAVLRWFSYRSFRWLPAAAFFLAQAFGMKYAAVFGGLPLAFVLGYAASREMRPWRLAAALAGTVFVFGGFWMARAYVLTGNPVAPLQLGMAAGQGLGQGPTMLAKLVRFAAIPWNVLFRGEDAFESPLPNPAGIVLAALAPVALFGLRRKPMTRAQRICAFFVVIYLFYWAAMLEKLRYAIPAFALLAVWLAAGARRFYDTHSRLLRIVLLGLVSYSLLTGFMGLMIVDVNGPQFAYFAGKLTKAGYLRAAMRAYGAVEFLRNADQQHAPVFGVDNLARFYSRDPWLFTGILCETPHACLAERIVNGARQNRAEYLILPESRIGETGVLDQLGEPPEVYKDSYFSVYHLKP